MGPVPFLFTQPLPEGVGWALVGGFAILCLARDFGRVRIVLPENRRLVPERVLQRGPVVGPLQFGAEMGTGTRTFLPSSAPYVLALALVLVGPSLAAVLAAGGGFATGRATVPWLRLLSSDQDGWDRRLATSSMPLVSLGTIGVAAAMLAAAVP